MRPRGSLGGKGVANSARQQCSGADRESARDWKGSQLPPSPETQWRYTGLLIPARRVSSRQTKVAMRARVCVTPSSVIVARLIALRLVVLVPRCPFSLTKPPLFTVQATNDAPRRRPAWSVWVQSEYLARSWPSYCGRETEIDYLSVAYLTQAMLYCGCARCNERRLAAAATPTGESTQSIRRSRPCIVLSERDCAFATINCLLLVQ